MLKTLCVYETHMTITILLLLVLALICGVLAVAAAIWAAVSRNARKHPEKKT